MSSPMKLIVKSLVILLAVIGPIVAFSSPESAFLNLLKSVQSPPKKPVVWRSATDLVPKQSFSIAQPESYFKDSCDNPSLQFLIPTTLNDDEYDDFIVHYWCDQEEFGLYDDQPTPDALVALQSESANSYRVVNESVFGQRLIGLGGASRKYVAKDINKDGYDDYFFAMNWEDGRSTEDPMTNGARPAGLLSNGLGSYEVVNMGERGWGHAVVVLTLEQGVSDVVFATFTGNSQAFRFENEEFSDVTGEYPESLINPWATGVLAIDNEIRTKYVVGTDSIDRGDFRNDLLRFFYMDQAGMLVAINYQEIEKAGTVSFINWNGEPGTSAVIEIDGILHLDGAIEALRHMKSPLDSSQSMVVGKMSAVLRADGKPIVLGEDQGEFEWKNVNPLVFFSYDDSGLYRIPSPLVNEEAEVNYNFYEGRDINGDGLEDLVVFGFTQPWRNARVDQAGKPILYLNNGNGSLVWEDLSSWPGYSNTDGELQGLMHDINNDGVEDLLIYGLRANAGGIQIHLMKRDNDPLPSPQASLNPILHDQ